MDQGRQLVFSSAAPLAELSGVEARLRSRLEGGLVVELPAPDAAVRRRVLERDLEAKLGGGDTELAEYLASRPADSVRAVQGMLQRVEAAASAKGTTPRAALARELLEEPAPARPAQQRRSASPRSSGVVGAGAGAVRSREKMAWEWPEVGERVIEEWG